MKRAVKFGLVGLVALGLAGLLIYGCGSSGGGGGSTEGVSFLKLAMGGVKLSYSSSARALDGTSTITGHVYGMPGNTAYSGVTIWAGTTAVATSAADGSYTLSGVPSDATTFTAVYHSVNRGCNAQMCHKRTTSEPMPSGIDFYLVKEGTAESVAFTVTVSDESGNPIPGATIAIDTLYTRSVQSTTTDAHGVFSQAIQLDPYSIDTITVLASKYGVGGAYRGGLDGTSGSVSVNLTIGQQATASGSMASAYSFTGEAIGVTPSGLFPIFTSASFSAIYTLSSPTGTYTFSTVPPPNTGDSLYFAGVGYSGFSASSHPRILMGVDVATVAPAAGSSFTQNFTVLEPVSVISVSSSESGGLVWLTATWEAPASWTPTYYMLATYYGTMCTTDLSATLPYWLASGTNPINQVQVFAFRASSGSITDLTSVFVSGYTYTYY
jgi:hypothetical protein